MLGEKFRSRKLLLILAFLLIDTDSITNSLLGVVDRTTDRKSDNSNSGSSSDSNSNSDRSSSSSTTNVILDRTLWLLDENSGLCLGTEGFSECGDTNLWKWQSTGSDSTPANGDGLLLEVASISSKQFPETQEKECLGRGKRFRKGKRTLRKTSCAKFPVASLTSLSWRFDPAIGRLSTGGFVSSVLGTSCVQEDGSLSSCEDYAVLREVFVQDSSTAGVSRDSNKRRIDGVEEELDAEEMEEGLIEEGTWTDPVTNLQLPRNLDKALASTAQEESSPARRQVFMGGGVYKKKLMGMSFNVYSIGWYIERDAVRNDPAFHPYKSMTHAELTSSEPFYQLMTEEKGYDRTLFAKMAMTIKKDLMIQGLLEELMIPPEHGKLLVKVSDGYENTQFEEGLEIIFTWRQARASNDFKERLEIRIGDFYAEIYHPGLPKMLMYQFFHDDPVSPDLKNSFMINFPALLNNELSVSPKAQTRVKRSPTPVAPESVNSYETNILFSLPFRAYFSTSLTASNMWSFADKSSSFIPSPSEIANRCVRNSQEDEEHSIPSMASTYSPSLVVKVLPTVVPTFQSLTNSVLSTVEYVVPSATEVSSSKPFDTEELETNSESSNSDSTPDLSGINSEESLICEGKVCKSDQNILRKKWKNFRKKIEEEVRVNKKLRDPFSELFYEKDLQQKSLQKAIPRRNFCYKTSSDFFTANRIAYIFIIIYFIILIVVSMPPALVKRGIKIVENSKRRSLKKLELIKSQFNNTLQKTLSKTSSLAKLARPTSADLKFFFK